MLYGHSLGGQMSGHLCQQIYKLSGERINRIYGMDVAGPLYGFGGKCQGIPACYQNDRECARHTTIFQSNPGELGTDDPFIGCTRIYLNRQRLFCQPNCSCTFDFSCSHSYVLQVFEALIKGFVFNASFSSFYFPIYSTIFDYNQRLPISLYSDIEPGFYDLDTY